MPTWSPSPIWAGEDAFIIGGGPSIRSFDFNLLKKRNVIGVNDAFRLGPSIVSYVLFGDAGFWRENMRALEGCGMPVVTCAPSLAFINVPWLYQMGRMKDGLHTGPVLGWNYSTGAAAVNLALTFGASRIFLLGFDMGKQEDGRSHWHDHRHKIIPNDSYERFIQGFRSVKAGMVDYPDRRVYNVTDGSSRLPVFEKISFDVFKAVLAEGAPS